MNYKNIFIILFLFCFCVLPLFAEDIPQPKYVKARVLEATTFDHEALSGSEIEEKTQQVSLKVLGGKFKGQTVLLEHMASGMMGGEMILKAGDKVILYVDEHPGEAESPDGSPIFNIADYARGVPVFWLAFFYGLLLIVVGGIKGLKSLASLLITIGLIFFVLFPLTLWGFNPLLVSIVIAGVVSLIVFRIIGGRTVKSLSAALGTLAGVAIAGVLAFMVGKMVHLTGLSSQESRILLYSMELKINYQGLLFGSILLGALGAVMDIGMSISSAIDEVRKVHPEANFKNLFDSGMNVGRDVMGTMSNTLILAYTGSALPLLLLLVANKVSFSKIINLEMISSEIVRALAGSIGLVLCIPITAAIAAYLHSKPEKKPGPATPNEWLKRAGRSKLLTIIFFILVFANLSFAQHDLTLSKCVKLALSGNKTILYSEQQVKTAELKVAEKNAALLPRFGLSALGGSLDKYSASFTLSQPLYSGGSLLSSKAKAEIELAQARDLLKNAKNELYFDVVGAYYTARQAQEVLAAKKGFLNNLEAFSLKSKKLYHRTRSPRLEALLQIEVQVGNAAQDVEAAKTNYQKSLRALLELIYQDNDDVALSDPLPLVTAGVEPMKLDEKTLQNNYEYRQELSGLKATQHDQVIASSALLPSLNLAGYYGWEWSTFPPADSSSQWVVSLELLLFDFMGTPAKVDQAKSLYQQKLTSLNILKRDLKKIYANIADDLKSARIRLTLSKENLNKAEKSLKLYQQRYASYTVNSRELLDAEQAALQAKMNCLSALLDHNLARIELHRLRGEARL